MADLTPTPSWDAVVRLETTTAALGGAGGPMNLQAQALLNRTELLKEGQDALAVDDDTAKGAALIGFDDATLAEFFKSKNNRVVASVAALRSLPGAEFTRAFVTSYYGDGGGGGGHYWRDAADTTSTNKGGTVIVGADSSRWKLLHSGSVDAQQFGAKGDGTTDDTTAIDAAIAAVSTVVMTREHLVNPATLSTGAASKVLSFIGGKLKTNFGGIRSLKIRTGGSFTAVPTISLTGGGGSGAAIAAIMGGRTSAPSAANSGYGFRDLLTVVGGTGTESMQIRVSGRNGSGGVTHAFIARKGKYTVLPSNPVTVTGGTGTGATFNIVWQIVDGTITAGSGYATAPAVSASGATVTPIIDAIGDEIDWRGYIQAPVVPIFSGYGAKKPTGVNGVIFPEWFGAADGTECGDALQRSLDAAQNRQWQLGAAEYQTARALTPPATARLQGVDRNTSVIRPTGARNLFHINAGFDLFVDDIGVKDPSNVMTSLSNAAFFFDATANLVQRVYFENVLLDIHGRGFATDNFERNEVFGCEFKNVNIYSRGASFEMFYTTGIKLRNVLGEHVGRTQDAAVLRDFWFYGNTAMLGGGLELENVISRAPANSGIVLEGVGTNYAYPKFLQGWLRDCSADNAGAFGVDLVGVEQCHIRGGYYALCGTTLGIANCIRVNGQGVTIDNPQVHDGRTANIYVFNSTQVAIRDTFVRRSGVFATNIGIEIDNAGTGVTEVQLIGNNVRSCSQGIRIRGAVNLVHITGNTCYFNGAGLVDGIVVDGRATNVINSANAT